MWQTGFDTPASSPQGAGSRRQHGSCGEKKVRVHPETVRGGDGPRGVELPVHESVKCPVCSG